jgi:hypothetical protein
MKLRIAHPSTYMLGLLESATYALFRTLLHFFAQEQTEIPLES